MEFESVIDVNVENNLVAPTAGRIMVAPKKRKTKVKKKKKMG